MEKCLTNSTYHDILTSSNSNNNVKEGRYTIMTKQEKILKALNELNNAEKVAVWNDYAQELAPDDYIYPMNGFDFDAVFSSPTAAVDAVLNGDFDQLDNYVAFDGYENLSSFNCLDDVRSPYDEEVLADYLYETGEYYVYLGIDDDEDDEEEGE